MDLVFKTKDDLISAIRTDITTKDNQAIKAMLKIFEYQTLDEQKSTVVREDNGVGFTSSDSELLTSFCNFYIKTGKLSEKQMGILKSKIGKYARQIVNHAIEQGKWMKTDGVWQYVEEIS